MYNVHVHVHVVSVSMVVDFIVMVMVLYLEYIHLFTLSLSPPPLLVYTQLPSLSELESRRYYISIASSEHTFLRRQQLYFSQRSFGSVLVKTDRPIYKPSQTGALCTGKLKGFYAKCRYMYIMYMCIHVHVRSTCMYQIDTYIPNVLLYAQTVQPSRFQRDLPDYNADSRFPTYLTAG